MKHLKNRENFLFEAKEQISLPNELQSAPKSFKEAQAFVKAYAKLIGKGFHPDTEASDYIDENDNDVFSAKEAKILDRNMEMAFSEYEKADKDIYAEVS